MKTKYIFLLATFFTLFSLRGICQSIIADLSDDKAKSTEIDLKTDKSILENKSSDINYTIRWKREKRRAPELILPASLAGGTASSQSILDTCSEAVMRAIIALDNAKDEGEVKKAVASAQKTLDTITQKECKIILEKRVGETRAEIVFPYAGDLSYNEDITLTISRTKKDGTVLKDLVYNFSTPERTRWLVHYGLSYAPSIISKTNKYFAFADTGVANRYTVTKKNDNGPKPWDNISATINFTYPFSSKIRNADLGFTAGFGISAGFELSGHTGLSLLIGDNVILGSGVVFMQRHKLRGEYKENQVIKTNLNFEALHEKVWLPELFFTIGFRFGSNPFAKKSSKESEDKDESKE